MRLPTSLVSMDSKKIWIERFHKHCQTSKPFQNQFICAPAQPSELCILRDSGAFQCFQAPRCWGQTGWGPDDGCRSAAVEVPGCGLRVQVCQLFQWLRNEEIRSSSKTGSWRLYIMHRSCICSVCIYIYTLVIKHNSIARRVRLTQKAVGKQKHNYNCYIINSYIVM